MSAALRVLLTAILLAVPAACTDAGGEGGAAAVVDAESPRDLARTVERLMPALERISGLDRVETLRVRRQPREAARDYVIERIGMEMPPAEMESLRRTYVALGLLPDTLDLEALLVELYTEQVLGYYAPSERTLFVVEDMEVDELQVIAHELVHALQDQHTDLDSIVAGRRGNDRQAAAHAALEGHAMLVMMTLIAERATRTQLDPASLPPPAVDAASALEAQDAEFPVFRRAPRIVRETLLFPYTEGATFVHALWHARAPLDRYPAPIDSLLPQSTEQIMRPVERFIRERDEPDAVAVDGFPADWRVLREDELGMFEISVFLAHHLGEAARARADGWEGDRYALLAAPDGDVLFWRSVWESTGHADAFAASVRDIASRRAGRNIIVRREDNAAVLVIDAPAGADISAIEAGQ